MDRPINHRDLTMNASEIPDRVREHVRFLCLVITLVFLSIVSRTGLAQASGVADGPTVGTFEESMHSEGELLAIVGTDPILIGDLTPLIQPIIEENRSRFPAHEIEKLRDKLLRESLVSQIETKALAQQFIREMVGPKPPKEYQEFESKIAPRLTKAFHYEYVPKMMERAKVSSAMELDKKLREVGSSLQGQLKIFQDSVMANEATSSNVPEKPRIPLSEIKSYYEEHRAEWRTPASATYRQISVLFRNYKTRDEALRNIEALGNEILLGGTPFDALAKKKSEDSSASYGGLYERIPENALKSKPIDRTVFSIPLNRLSEIIEDDDGFHIVEVLSRESASERSLAESQQEIRETLERLKKQQAKEEYVAEVLASTMVWSRWPDDFEGARPLSEAVLTR